MLVKLIRVCVLCACVGGLFVAGAACQPVNPYPLSKPGGYQVGYREYKYQDESRKERPVTITVWYPASPPASYSESLPFNDAQPNRKGAPYPLILSSTKIAWIFAPALVSRGFTWVSVNYLDTYREMNEQMFEQPLDILFALRQVASTPPAGMEGMIDAEHAGVTGYSFDGYNTLAMSGARIDPQFYMAQCVKPDPLYDNRMSAFSCKPAQDWSAFCEKAGKDLTTSPDGLWQPMTDSRIRAVIPMAGEGWWLFGERGLAAVDRPTMILVATEDELYAENARIYQHIGTAQKTFISFVGQDHFMVMDEVWIARMTHFMAAFFGYHLQGKQDLAQYFTKEFVSRQKEVKWGVVDGK
jgi:hypothetical protein